MDTLRSLLVGLALGILSGQAFADTALDQHPERCPLAPKPLPRTLDEAVTRIVTHLTPESRKTLLETKRGELINFHTGWGTGIRNDMCLWGGGNEALIRSACGGQLCHPDDASMRIMEAVWDRIHAKQ